MVLGDVTERVLQAAFRVHTITGPGLLESVYEAALVHELRKVSLRVATQVEVPVVFDGIKLDVAFRADVIVESRVISNLRVTVC